MLKIFRYIFNFKVLLGATVFGVGVFAVLVWVLWSAKTNDTAQVPATAILKIIEAPTQTPPGIRITPTPTQAPTTASQATPAPSGDIAIGDYVQVSGTGGDGLRLHNNAGVSTKVNYVAKESEVFIVKDGPIDADGFVWWELEDPYNNNTVGWGVANYLAVLQNP